MNKKIALITGASSGIGYELAKLFGKDQYRLVLVARDFTKTDTTVFADDTIYIQTDLSNDTGTAEVIARINSEQLTIHTLVNNAGFGEYGLFATSDIQRQLQMIDLNVRALTELTHTYLPHMLMQKDGAILNVASTAAFQPGPLMSVYFATKAYVLYFTEGIAEEVSGSGVHVTALCPGPTQSNFIKASHMHKSKLVYNKKLPTAEEVAIFGYKALQSGRVVAIHGFFNRCLVLLNRFAPRFLIRKIVKQLQSPHA
jgi:short-subunit dehydrogenase